MQSTALSLSTSGPAAATGIVMPPSAVASSPPVLRIILPTARPEALRAALFEMARQGDCDAGRQLLQSGLVMPGASEPGTGECALMLAVENRQTSFVRMLLQSGAAVDQRRADGMTSLMLAAAVGDAAIVQALLLAGAQVDHVSNTAISSLILTAWSGMTDVVNMLLTSGATVDHATTFGWTALMRAAQGGHFDTVVALIANGSDVEHVECNGRTALMIAAEAGHAATAQALADAGADITRRDKVGLSAAEIAHATGHRKLAKVLSERASSQPVYLPNDDDPDATPKRETTRTAKTTWTTVTTTACSAPSADTAAAACTTVIPTTSTITATSTTAARAAKALTEEKPEKRPPLSALLDAIADNDLQTLRRLLAALKRTSHDVTARLDRAGPLPAFEGPDDENVFTPLMAAAYFGHADMIKALVDAGATTDLAGYKGRTALRIAENLNHVKAVDVLVHSGAHMELNDDEGWAAEDIVAYKKRAAEMAAGVKDTRKMLHAFPKTIKDPDSLAGKSDSVCSEHVTYLVAHARKEGLIYFLRELISRGRDMNAMLNFPAALLCYDSCHNHYHRGWDVPPLGHAMNMGDGFMVALLIGSGADINKPIYATSHALKLAAGCGTPLKILTLIAIGAKVNQACPEFGGTALMSAVMRNRIRAMQMLIEAGAKVNQVCKSGMSALHYAALDGATQALGLLILKGANLNQVDKYGYTPLMYAAEYGQQSTVEALIKAGAKINMQAGFRGMTALMIASVKGHLSTVQLLLNHGAKANIKEKGKHTALDHAIENDHRDIAKLLTDHGVTSKKQ